MRKIDGKTDMSKKSEKIMSIKKGKIEYTLKDPNWTPEVKKYNVWDFKNIYKWNLTAD